MLGLHVFARLVYFSCHLQALRLAYCSGKTLSSRVLHYSWICLFLNWCLRRIVPSRLRINRCSSFPSLKEGKLVVCIIIGHDTSSHMKRGDIVNWSWSISWDLLWDPIEGGQEWRDIPLQKEKNSAPCLKPGESAIRAGLHYDFMETKGTVLSL